VHQLNAQNRPADYVLRFIPDSEKGLTLSGNERSALFGQSNFCKAKANLGRVVPMVLAVSCDAKRRNR
jgi:hypothetical protein